MIQLPISGFVRLSDIIGQEAVTENQAEANRNRGKGPKRPRKGLPALVPVKKSCWWNGIRDGRFPKPVKLGNGRATFWRVEDIKELIASASEDVR